MPLPRPTRARSATRSLLASLILALTAALVLAVAAPASAVTRKQASKKALAALGSSHGSGSVIVFGLPNPVRPGSRVTQSGSKRTIGKVGKERAFFFYEDSGPFLPYPHRGRVALVGASSGKVKVSKTINRAPLLNGKLPAFLKTMKNYSSPEYRVFQRAGDPDASIFAQDPNAPGTPTLNGGNGNAPPKANSVSVTAKQNGSKRITLTGSDDDGDLLTFHITKAPLHGTLSGQAPDVVYTPNPGYLGKDDFSFRTNDGDHESNTAKVSITVVLAGLPPTVMTSTGGCTNYVEQSPAVVIDGGLNVSDPDDTILDSAKVRIPVPPPPPGEDPGATQNGDELLFTDQNGITGSYDHLTGTLSLTGDSSVANYQTALRSVRYRNLSDGNPPPTKDVQFTVNDAASNSPVATKQICITGGGTSDNNKPIGETSEGGLDYIENDGPLPVDAGFVALDNDSANLSKATIKFTLSQPPEDENGNPIGVPVNNYAPDQDVLAYQDQETGITGSWDDDLGVLTLTGSASVEDYQAAIRSVTYENTSERPSDAPRTIRFQLTDSDGANSVASNRGILVTPVNDAPVVTTSEGSVTALGSDPVTVVDSALTVGDVDDDDLESARVVISGGAEAGDELALDELPEWGISVDWDGEVLTLTGTAPVATYQTALRQVEYRHPGGNPGGSKTVEFTVNDGDLDSLGATRTVLANDKPVLDTTDTALSYTENAGAVAVDPGITAADDDSPELAGATAEITDNYTPAEDTLSLPEQSSGITGAWDGDAGTLTLSGAATVADYQAALADVRYENSSDDPSSDTRTVTFEADDGAANDNLSDTVSRDIEITPVNDAPVVTTSGDSTAYTENDLATAVDSGLTVADAEDDDIESAVVRISAGLETGDTLEFTDQNGISGGGFDSESGTLTLTGSASVADYETALRSVGFASSSDNPSSSRTVEFTVNDGDLDSTAATKDIAVTPVNDAPAVTTSDDATPYTIGDTNGVAVDTAVTASDVDNANLESALVRVSADTFQDGDQLALDEESLSGITVDYDGVTGELTLTGSAPVEDYQAALAAVKFSTTAESPSASKTVEFTVYDGYDNSNTATKEIALAQPPDNDAPVVTTSATPTTYTPGDTEGVTVDPDLTVTDADDENLESGVVRIAVGEFVEGDELVFADTAEITSDYDAGVLTLTGSASVAAWQAALRTVKYRHTGAEPPPAATNIEFTVNDGDVDSNTASRLILIGSPPE